MGGNTALEVITLTLSVLCVVLLAMLVMRKDNSTKRISDNLENSRKNMDSYMQQSEARFQSFAAENNQKLENIRVSLEKNLTQMREDNFRNLSVIREDNNRNLSTLREESNKNLNTMREDNNKKLDEMRIVVDEKLQKTINQRMNESFKLVNDRLEQVYKGLGEMQSLAAGVGDLKKVLSNVKTRGILGEVQLAAILEEILTPEQYDTNVATKAGSRAVVEFAVKIPTEDGYIHMPIDSKFPGETYGHLRDAYESGSQQAVNDAAKVLISTIKAEAKDIRDKYLDPPNTTDFAVMFLPFEGLYAEVINRGMLEVLQRDYHVNIAGPSTMAALLNSLQMGFRTFAIQKRSGEVWNVLSAVKTEFNKFESALKMTQQRINQANDELDKLVGVRTRQIQRKLKTVAELDPAESVSLLSSDEMYSQYSDTDSEE